MTRPAFPLAQFFAYILITFGLSWTFWIAAALSGQDVLEPPILTLHTLGGFTPSLAGVLMLYRTRTPEQRRDFWRRVVNFRQIGPRWWLVIVLTFPLLALIAIGLGEWMGDPPHPFTTLQLIAEQPLFLFTLLLAGLFVGPLAEELGWRGYAQDILLARWNLPAAGGLLGFFWGIWHLPLFFISGTPQAAMGTSSLEFWLFLFNPIPLSILFAWVYVNTGRSILSAILLHLSFNFTANLFYPLSNQILVIHAALLVVITGMVLVRHRRQSFNGAEIHPA
jgi:uncharacterized protein